MRVCVCVYMGVYIENRGLTVMTEVREVACPLFFHILVFALASSDEVFAYVGVDAHSFSLVCVCMYMSCVRLVQNDANRYGRYIIVYVYIYL